MNNREFPQTVEVEAPRFDPQERILTLDGGKRIKFDGNDTPWIIRENGALAKVDNEATANHLRGQFNSAMAAEQATSHRKKRTSVAASVEQAAPVAEVKKRSHIKESMATIAIVLGAFEVARGAGFVAGDTIWTAILHQEQSGAVTKLIDFVNNERGHIGGGN